MNNYQDLKERKDARKEFLKTYKSIRKSGKYPIDNVSIEIQKSDKSPEYISWKLEDLHKLAKQKRRGTDKIEVKKINPYDRALISAFIYKNIEKAFEHGTNLQDGKKYLNDAFYGMSLIDSKSRVLRSKIEEGLKKNGELEEFANIIRKFTGINYYANGEVYE